jgi:3-dehydrosphinganine reductase
VWCCAGFTLPAFFADATIDTLRGQMDTIYWSAAYMAHATLNHWLGQPPRQHHTAAPSSKHIIFTSSTLAFFPLAGYGPYSPAKSAMKSLSDTLVQEAAMHNAQYNQQHKLSPSDPASMHIRIHTLFPMGILTPGYAYENTLKSGLTVMLEKDDKPQHPDKVARIAVEGLERGDYLITTMFLGHVLRGVGMGASLRNGLGDLFWSVVGGLAVWFVVPDFIAKCRKWGREHVDERRK